MPVDVQERPQTVDDQPEKRGLVVDPVLDMMLSAFEVAMQGKAGNPDAQRSTQALFGSAIAQWAKDSVAYEKRQSSASPSANTGLSETIPEVSPVLPPLPPTPSQT